MTSWSRPLSMHLDKCIDIYGSRAIIYVILGLRHCCGRMANKNSINAIEFIALVRQQPVLWDSRLEDYKSAENKPIVWDKIAHEINCDRREHTHTLQYTLRPM